MPQELSVFDFPDGGQLSAGAFDYGDLSTPDVAALETHAHVIRDNVNRARETAVECALRIGQELDGARTRFANHGNGRFNHWCQGVCGCKRTTAHRCVAAYHVFKDCSTVEQSFEVSAVYELSAKKCPVEARREALELAERGEHITKSRAKEIVRAHTTASRPAIDVTASEPEQPDILDVGTTDFEQACREIRAVIVTLQGRAIPDLDITKALRATLQELGGSDAQDPLSQDNTDMPVSVVTEPSEGDDPEDVADSSPDARDASMSQPTVMPTMRPERYQDTPADDTTTHIVDSEVPQGPPETDPHVTLFYNNVAYVCSMPIKRASSTATSSPPISS